MTYDRAAEVTALVDRGHTEECAEFWCDVVVLNGIGERWDHWTQPPCAECDARRAAKGMT